MTEAKGEKSKLIVTDQDALDFVNYKAKNKRTSGLASAKFQDNDYTYLKGVFACLVANYDQKKIKDVRPKEKRAGGFPRRFTPREMFDNAVKYISVTMEHSQPLTITGLGIFMGMHRKGIFDMLNQGNMDKIPEYSFIYDMTDFIEMYNEFAAHKKLNPAGPIFILKNFGWSDKLEIEASATKGALTDEERAAAQKRISGFSETLKR